MEAFPSNSRRPLPQTQAEVSVNGQPVPVEEKKLDKVVTGKVIKRKKPFSRRLKETFFNENGGVFSYLLKEVLVPALQDTATTMVQQGIEKAVYGEVRSPGRTVRGAAGAPRTHISYDRYTRPTPPTPPSRRPVTQPDAIDIGEVVLDSKIDAQMVAEKLFELVEEYGIATVANLNDLLAQSSVYTDHKYGWTDLDSLVVRRVRDGYLLVLPPPEDLDRR